MRTRTRVAMLAAGVALAGVAAASAVPGSSPVATLLPAPADRPTAGASTPEATATTVAGSTGSTRTQTQTPPRGSVSAGAGIRELRTGGKGANTVVVAADGAVTAATAETGKVLTTIGPDAFTTRYAAAFGLTSAHTLTKTSAEALPGGDTVSRYQQTAGGLPVLGGEIVVTSQGKNVRSAIAETTGLSPVSTKATVAASTAAETARTAAADETGLPADALKSGTPKLALYDPTLIGAPGAASLRPTWQVAVTDGDGGDVATVLVDALDGKTRLTMSERQSARNRIVCDLANTGVNLDNEATYRCTPETTLGAQSTTRKEGGAASTVAQVNLVYDMIGATYDFYKANFGADSFDGRGGQIQATVRVCYATTGYRECPYENAYWDGTQFVFGDGFATDDVVGHEYTHGVTEHTSHLLYAYQAGAINEALSDIMGEFIDQQYTAANEANPSLKWQLGEDLPASIGTLRSMDSPNLHSQPQYVGQSPYWYNGETDAGGVHTNSGVANYAAYLIAAGPNGIGNTKSAQLWWRVMHMLPSAADYSTLGRALTSACSQLIGHFGFTAANCTAVAGAVADTKMDAGSQSSAGIAKINLCDTSAAQPIDTLYFDGFERRGTWATTSADYWLRLPSLEAPYQYAVNGIGSLNAWTPSTAGNGTTATMPKAVTVPAGKTAYLHFSQATLDPSSGARVDLQLSVDGGAWQAPPAGIGYTSPMPQTRGYSDVRLNLSGYAGKTVTFRFVLQAASNSNYFDWYVDNFRIYMCSDRPSAPAGYAYYSGTTAVVDGLSMASGFIPAGQTLDHYELRYSAPLTGAPTVIPGDQGGFTLTGTDGVARTVRVRAVTNTGLGGDWTSLFLTTAVPPICATAAYPLGPAVCRGLPG